MRTVDLVPILLRVQLTGCCHFNIFSFYNRTSEIITFYIEVLSLQTIPFLGGLSCFIFLGLQVARTTRRRCTSKAESFSDMSATPITCMYSNHSPPDQMYGHQILITRSRERNTTISKGRGGRVAPMPAHLDEVGDDHDHVFDHHEYHDVHHHYDFLAPSHPKTLCPNCLFLIVLCQNLHHHHSNHHNHHPRWSFNSSLGEVTLLRFSKDILLLEVSAPH